MDAARKAIALEKVKVLLDTKKMAESMESEFTRAGAVEVFKTECAQFFLDHGLEIRALLSTNN